MKLLLTRVGVSAVNVDDVKANLCTEIKDWDFDRVVDSTDAAWNEELDKIKMKTTDLNDKTILYTALFHTTTAPSVFSDADSRYRGNDGKVYEGDFTNYTVLSLWDTYRVAHPLMTITHSEKQRDIA